MRRTAALLALLLTAGCATHAAPPAVPEPSPDLFISEALPAESRLCVMRNPWNDATAVCLSVGELRALLRHRQDVVARGVGR